MSLRAIVFDFDGVIVESNDIKTAAFDAVFSAYPEHHDAMMAFHRANVSLSRVIKFQHFVSAHLGRATDDPLVAELGERFSAEVRDRVTACPMVPGAQALLDRLRGRLPLFLASVTPEAELNGILERRGLRHYFQGVYGCPPWTKPDAIRDVLALVGGSMDVVLIGDSAGDQRAAHETGIEFLARNSGLPFERPVKAADDLYQVAEQIYPRLELS
jgi:phosphoglycolate phosphatase-like HAD superfamily hydrolase